MKNIKKNKALENAIVIAICFLLSSLVMMILLVFLPNVVGLNLLPNNPIENIIVWAVLCLVYFFCFKLFSCLNLKKWIKIVLLLPNLITLPVLLVLIAVFINTLVFTESVCVGIYEGIPYAVVVRENDAAQKMEDLKGYRIEMLKGVDEGGIHGLLQTKTNWEYTTLYAKNGLNQMASDLMDEKAQAIMIRRERLEYLYNHVDVFQDKTKVIYEFGLEEKSYHASDTNALPNSFVIYVNGFDSSEDMLSMMGESKVNLLMMVNREQRKIVFMNIPRDSYVQFAGINNLKDKFSSTGLYGIEESIDTIEQLYDVDVDFYVSLDLSNLRDIINQLGGIDAVSHGTDNEAQQIVEATIRKLIGTDILRRNYGNILQAMEGSFRTDISNNTLMTALVSQIISRHDWQFESVTAGNYDI